jgi:uncharacterized protein YdeI (YjbR/CyaY-like superfamily)
MGKKDERVNTYIQKSAPFARPILKQLRKVVHAGCPKVEESIKWSMPHFDYKGVLCGMAAFKEHCAFGFWKAKLIVPNMLATKDAMGDFGRITSLQDLPSEKTLVGYVRKAAALNDSGAKVPGRDKPKRRPTLKVPSYFVTALNQNTKARTTFDNLSPSCRREYVEWVVGAKRDETRQRRLRTSIEWLNQGKPHNWRYIKWQSNVMKTKQIGE